MNLTIREYIGEDISFYLEGEVDAFQSTYPGLTITEELKKELKDNVVRSISSGVSKGYTAVTHEPVGFIILETQYIFNIPTGYVENIYVKDDARNKGYGRKLLKFAEDICKKNGLRILQLDVSIHHQAALKLYKSEGYSVASYRMEKNIAL
jgi:ribosomal protein S18 acetylase RimI-like enzyme